MSLLFPDLAAGPPGFSYYPDFLSAKEEQVLLDHILCLDLHPFLFQGFEAKRRVASYGLDYNFDMRSLSSGRPIPDVFIPIINKVAIQVGISASDFKELLVTGYPIGALINWHRDAPPFELIAGISLAASCTFKFRPHDQAKRTRKSIINFSIAPRSLYVIQADARSKWQHSTAPVTQIRYSITLRTVASPARSS